MACAFALAPGVARALDYPDLSGTWALDRSKSDDLAASLRSGGGGRGGGMRGGPPPGSGGRGGGGGGGRHGGGPGGGGEPQRGPDLEDLNASLERLVIAHRDPELKIHDGQGNVRVLFTDGRKTEEEHSHGGTTTVRTTWKDGHVEIVSKPETGPKRTETLAVSADRTELRVTLRLEGERDPITVHLVYVAAKPGTAPAPAAPSELPPEL